MWFKFGHKKMLNKFGHVCGSSQIVQEMERFHGSQTVEEEARKAAPCIPTRIVASEDQRMATYAEPRAPAPPPRNRVDTAGAVFVGPQVQQMLRQGGTLYQRE